MECGMRMCWHSSSRAEKSQSHPTSTHSRCCEKRRLLMTSNVWHRATVNTILWSGCEHTHAVTPILKGRFICTLTDTNDLLNTWHPNSEIYYTYEIVKLKVSRHLPAGLWLTAPASTQQQNVCCIQNWQMHTLKYLSALTYSAIINPGP